MPIVGVSDELTRMEQSVNYPLFAKVKKGAEKPERGVGKNLDYFRFEWNDPKAEAVFIRLYGKNVDSIPIVTLGGGVENVFDSHYRKYTTNQSLQMMCDGCTIKKAANRDLVGENCICDPVQRDDRAHSGTCAMKGYLYFTIPELCLELGYMGQFVMGTGSEIEIRDISTLLQTVFNTVGTLEHQQFILRRVERQFDVDIKGDGKNSNIKQSMVELIPPLTSVLKIEGHTPKQLTATPVIQEQTNNAPPALPEPPAQLPEPAPNQSPEKLSAKGVDIITRFLTRVAGVNLPELWAYHADNVGEGLASIDDFIGESTFEGFARVVLMVIAETGIQVRVNTWLWDEENNRHYFNFLTPELPVLMYSRELLREAGVEGSLIHAMERSEVDSMKRLDMKLEELPMVTIEKAIGDNKEIKYFQVTGVKAAKSNADNLDDIPF